MTPEAPPWRLSPEALQDLFVLSLRFHLEALDRLHLPAFTGSSFRGILGRALKQAACRRTPLCENCQDPGACVYSYLFETAAPREHGVNRGSDEVPRPFVLRPPRGNRTLAPGERFFLGLQLLGRGTDYLAYFLHCLEEMGRHGVGQARSRFRVRRAAARDPNGKETTFYRGDSGKVLANPAPWPLADLLQKTRGLQDCEAVEVRFLTPTRLVHRGELVGRPEFHVLVRSLLRRLDLLRVVHGEGPLDLDFRAAVHAAMQCRLEKHHLRWFDWERHSLRQQRSHRLGGVVGMAVYRGPVGGFLPLLVAGTAVHVGKATTFGLGELEIRVGL